MKVPVFSPEPMFKTAGTVTLVLLLANVTLAAPEVAAVNVTVQSEVPGAFTVAGEQVKLPSCAATVRVTVAAWLWPLSVAVTIAL